jgi:ABC-type sugar transport system substrate-binding protein
MTMVSKRHRCVLRALAIVAVAVVACATTSVGSTGAAALRKPLIVWLEQGAGNPYWDAEHGAAAEAGRRLGFRFEAVSGNLNPSDQAAILRQLVDERPDLVMVNAVDLKTIRPSLRYAKAKHVPTLLLNGVDASATASIMFDELRSGRIVARYALGLLRRSKLSGKIVVLEGVRGQPANDLRASGFIEVMQQAGARIVALEQTNWQADIASVTMRNWLARYPDLSMVFALSDNIAVPAIDVADRQNRLCTLSKPSTAQPSCVAFVSIDGFHADEVARRRLSATDLYSPYWTGYNYARLASEIVAGKRFEKTTVVNSLLVTPANAACVSRITGYMRKNLATFDFDRTLQQIARAYRCEVLDDSR